MNTHIATNRTSQTVRLEKPASKPETGKTAAVEETESFSNSSLARTRLAFPIISLLVIFACLAASVLFGNYFDEHTAVIHLVQALLTVTGMAVTGLLVVRIRQQLLEPLDSMREWSRRIRAGNLEGHIPMPARGEFAKLIRDINSLTDELNILTEEMDQRVREQTAHIANKTRSLEILYDIATSLSSTSNLEDLLEQFLDTLMILVDAEAASVRLLSDNQTRLVASRGLGDEVKEQELFVDVNRCLCGQISQHGGLGIQKGIESCNQYLDCSIVSDNCKEVVVVPLQYRDSILGVYNLFLDRPSSELGKDARDLLNSIGKHLGLAIEKARLDNNARRLAIMEERNIIGSELHDSLAQSLVSMRLQVKMLGEILHKKDVRSAQNEVRRLNTAVEDAHTSLRELLSNFRTRMDERGLLYAVNDCIHRFRQETGINVFLHNDSSGADLGLSPAQEFQAFRIIQEALANIKKHSNACNVRILMHHDDDNFSILVEDDGHGIEEQPESDMPGEHIGLNIMQERAAAINGEVTIESEPGEGTRIYLNFPVNPQITIQ
jgi:two-component system nitrate/nitrite sensor histidine kinase NarX